MNDNTGHGHVWARPDGIKARCGGLGLCATCRAELASVRMTLRDKFAMAAVTGMFANTSWDEAKAEDMAEDMACYAYSFADEMLKERAK